MAAPGLFISFEGIDGAGKTSHIGALANAFRAAGRQVVHTREPGGTPLAEQLRELLLHTPMDALCEVLLAFAGRRDHVLRVIAPALERGEVVLCDRFTDATFAYQGAGRGVATDLLSKLELSAQSPYALDADLAPGSAALIEPALTLWFDLPPAAAAARLVTARAPDRFESEPLDFFNRVAAGYAARAAAAPGRIVRIDADQPQAAVAHEVARAIAARGWLDAA